MPWPTALLLSLLLHGAATSQPPAFSSLSDFTAALRTLPCRESGDYAHDSSHHRASLFPPSGAAFTALAHRYLASAQAHAAAPLAWPLDDAAHVARLTAAALGPEPAAADAAAAGAPLALLPHVARVDLPLGTRLHVFGDLHGAFHSLLRHLQHLAALGALNASTLALAPPHALAFLGDYVDRGTRGVETMALLLALKAANPARVHLARGNHEDLAMNEGSFLTELQGKFPAPAAPHGVQPAVLRAILRVYESLPHALYLGTVDALPGWCHSAQGGEVACPAGQEGLKAPWRGMQPPPRHLQGVHGGLEVGFDPRPLLRYYSTAAAAGAGAGAGTEPQVHRALIHGYERSSWLEGLPPALRQHPVMPQDIQEEVRGGIFRDWGVKLRGSAGGGAGGAAAAGAAAGAAGGEEEESCEGLLAQARQARAEAAAQWEAPGGSHWPLAPLEANPADGFMWADFIVSGWRRTKAGVEAGLVHARGRGLAYGLALTDHFLGSRGLVGILRAHQHNNAGATGPMLERVIGGRGAFNNWGGSSSSSSSSSAAPPGAGHVTTFLSGAFIPGLGFERDARGLLSLDSADPRQWSLQLCSQAAPRDACAAAGGAASARRFACEPMQWRAVLGEEYAGADTGLAGEGEGEEGGALGAAQAAELEASERLPGLPHAQEL